MIAIILGLAVLLVGLFLIGLGILIMSGRLARIVVKIISSPLFLGGIIGFFIGKFTKKA